MRRLLAWTFASSILAILGACGPGVSREQALSEERPLVRVAGMQERAGSVHILPLGAPSQEEARDLSAYFEERLGLRSAVLPPMEVPRAAHDPAREQLVAETLVAAIVAAHPQLRGDVILAVTDQDLYSADAGYNFVFSYREPTDSTQVAVMSTARMDQRFFRRPADREWTRARLRKIATKNLGLLYYGLSGSDDPGSVLYRNVGGIEELDRMGFGF